MSRLNEPKRPKCNRCGRGDNLKPIMYRPYNNTSELIVPLWHCTRCEYNTGSEMIDALNAGAWDVDKTYEELLERRLTSESTT